MLQSFWMVGQQVLHLFFIVAAGFALGKAKLMDARASLGMSNLTMYVVTPCMLVVAFQRPLEWDTLRGFGLAIAASVLIHLVNILLSKLLIRDSDRERGALLRFGTSFSNSGFMAYPLQTALLGTIGVFYGSAYVLIFTVGVWTYGLYLMGQRISVRSLLLNPGVLSVLLAIVVYLTQLTIPEVILTPVTWLSNLNTPLPMVVLGYQLSQADLRPILRLKWMWISMLLRLLVLPAAAFGLCLMLHLPSEVLIATLVAAAAPPAAILSMFAVRFQKDAQLSSGVVCAQTLCSVLTMPLIVGLAQYLISR